MAHPQLDGSPTKEPRSGIVWLASYPKSGNTWVRTFLHNLMKTMAGEADPQGINDLGRFTAGLVSRELYAKVLGFEPTSAHKRDVAAVRHEVQRRVAEELEGLIFIKTHQALMLDRGSTTINFAVTAGAIYIIRNPLDVAISYSHHIGRSLDDTIAIMGSANAEMEASETQVHEVCGSWSQHVVSWTRKPHRAVHIMRYEDMLHEPSKIFAGLADHLLFSPTVGQLDQAIASSSFEQLRAQEDLEGFREKPKFAHRFFREGREGQWKTELSTKQIDRIVNDHGTQMERFGYLPR
jgi:hypothetical protein